MEATILKKEVGDLKKEVRILRSAIIGVIGRDKEGVYRPEFVKEILHAANEKSTRTFRDAESFLSALGGT